MLVVKLRTSIVPEARPRKAWGASPRLLGKWERKPCKGDSDQTMSFSVAAPRLYMFVVMVSWGSRPRLYAVRHSAAKSAQTSKGVSVE